ncbi:MAG: sulfotransferase family 2 domain-containing protein [Actinomycetota bacterium]
MEWRHTVWPEGRLIYTAIPKAANTSVKVGLLNTFRPDADSDSPHSPDAGYQTVDPDRIGAHFPEFCHFTVVRNPFDRLVSFWSDKIVGDGMNDGLRALGFEQGMSFADSVSLACSLSDDATDAHIRSQTFLLANARMNLRADLLLRFEFLEADWDLLTGIVAVRSGIRLAPLPLRQVSEHEGSASLYNDSTRRMVVQRYAEDFRLLNYPRAPTADQSAANDVPTKLRRHPGAYVLDLQGAAPARERVVRSTGGHYLASARFGSRGQLNRLTALETGRVPAELFDVLIVDAADLDADRRPHATLAQDRSVVVPASGPRVESAVRQIGATSSALISRVARLPIRDRPFVRRATTASVSSPSVVGANSRIDESDTRRRRSIRRGPISPRLSWTEAADIHPSFAYNDPERRAVQRAAREQVMDLLDADPLEQHSCPSCGGRGWREVADVERLGLRFPMCVCRYCGLVQAEPRPTQAFYNRFYAEFYRELFEGRSTVPTIEGFRSRASRRPRRFVDWALRQQEVREALSKNGLVVEVGCSAGLVVSQFVKAGHRVIGLDLDADFMQIGRDLGYDLRVGKLEDANLDERPSMIYYHHVLEHIADVGAEIDRCAELLERGSLLVIAVPGLDYVRSAYGGDLLQYLQIPHVYNFSLVSLCALMLPRGFELVRGDETVRAVFRRCEPRPADELFAVERAVAVWRMINLEQGFSSSAPGPTSRA